VESKEINNGFQKRRKIVDIRDEEQPHHEEGEGGVKRYELHVDELVA